MPTKKNTGIVWIDDRGEIRQGGERKTLLAHQLFLGFFPRAVDIEEFICAFFAHSETVD